MIRREPRPGVRITLRRLARAEAGSAAIEFALVSTILLVLFVNLIDFSFLIWAQMEVETSAQMGAQAAYAACSSAASPATTNCPTLNSVVTTAIQDTSLGTAVALASGSPSESYYCATASGLESMGGYSSPPSPYDCSGAGNASASPGDYMTVSVSYSFAPLFAGVSLAGSRTLTASGMQRLR
jgi:Flp pilus assembly protein TadG